MYADAMYLRVQIYHCMLGFSRQSFTDAPLPLAPVRCVYNEGGKGGK